MFGKLSLDAVPFHEPIVMVTIAGIILGGLALVGLITYFGKWTYLWKEWLTSVDHKRLGIMYIIVAIVMLLRGFADAIMMRSQQALASAGEAGFLPPHHYDQIFTAHGVIMIFFVAMPFVIGLMNLVVPLQIGARDDMSQLGLDRSFATLAAGEQAVLDRLLPICKKYGAAVVGLTLDENGIPALAEQRFALAQKIVAAAEAAGIPREDVYIDCLTLTASRKRCGKL